MAATSAPAPTGNPILDDPDSGQQTFTHPAADNPIISDPETGKTTGAPSMLGTSWPSLGDIIKSGWANLPSLQPPHMPGSSGPQPVVSQPIVSNIGTGFGRGVRDVLDKTTQGAFASQGYNPSQAELDQIQQQQATDRAQFDKQYGGDPSAQAGRIAGNVAVTAPVLGPVGEGVGAGLRMIPALAPGIRGIGGIASRAVERGISGGAAGGTQAGLTSDPSQPFGSQIATGAEWGAGLSTGLGGALDTLSNLYRRLSGSTVRTVPNPNPPPGAVPGTTPSIVPDDVVERARQATLLQREGVPFQASQISNDPVLQFTNKYGSQMPGSGAGDFINDQQLPRVRNALMQKAEPGTPASLVTPTWVENNDARLDNMYNTSVRAVPTVPSADPATGLSIDRSFAGIRSQIPSSLPPDAQGQIHGAMNDISDTFRQNGGQISGDDAQRLTRRTSSTVSPLLDSDNPDVRRFGMQIRDQVNQRLRSQMTGDQQTTFDQANGQFRALRTLDNVADSTGSFTPGQLYKETTDTAKQFNSPGSLDELSRAANTVIQPTLDGRGLLGKATGIGAPLSAGLITGSVLKPLLDWATTGGAGTATVMGSALANRLLQGANRAGGVRAMNAALSSGGGPSVADLQNALDLLRRPAVAAQQQRPQ